MAAHPLEIVHTLFFDAEAVRFASTVPYAPISFESGTIDRIQSHQLRREGFSLERR